MKDQEELVNILYRNDSKSFEILYNEFAPALYGFILKQIPDSKLASTILQQSFARIWKDKNQYDASKTRILSWMLRITIQQCNASCLPGDKNLFTTHYGLLRSESERVNTPMLVNSSLNKISLFKK